MTGKVRTIRKSWNSLENGLRFYIKVHIDNRHFFQQPLLAYRNSKVQLKCLKGTNNSYWPQWWWVCVWPGLSSPGWSRPVLWSSASSPGTCSYSALSVQCGSGLWVCSAPLLVGVSLARIASQNFTLTLNLGRYLSKLWWSQRKLTKSYGNAYINASHIFLILIPQLVSTTLSF